MCEKRRFPTSEPRASGSPPSSSLPSRPSSQRSELPAKSTQLKVLRSFFCAALFRKCGQSGRDLRRSLYLPVWRTFFWLGVLVGRPRVHRRNRPVQRPRMLCLISGRLDGPIAENVQKKHKRVKGGRAENSPPGAIVAARCITRSRSRPLEALMKSSSLCFVVAVVANLIPARRTPAL